MSAAPGDARRVLYIIACGAGPSSRLDKLVTLAQRNGWEVCVIATPDGRKFVDVSALERLTGHPVRSEYRHPGQQDPLPSPDAIIVAPATTNTINKWAAGISDTLALGLLVETIGKGLPVVALPFTNRAQAAHPIFERNIESLRVWGATVLYGPDIHPLHEPGTGMQSQVMDRYPWQLTLEALKKRL
jgi:phosphopantothenoylcysteine synthetase/decarboxylase